jgi:hypothetical protein
MIKVIKNDKNIIHYECDCGTKGMCTVKPAKEDAAIVFDVRCPNCFDSERITLVQYSSDDVKNKIVGDLDDVDLSWVPTFNEELGD